MKFLRLLAVALFALASPAAAQWQTPNHSVPLGRGAGVTGFGNAVPGTAGLPFVSNGASSDPSFRVAPANGGGTGADNSTNSAGDVLASNEANGNFVHTAFTTVLNAACGVAPNTCAVLFGCSSISWYGGVGDGTADNVAAFNAWFSGLGSGSGCLEFGAGKYAFNSAVSKTMASGRQTIQLRGLGVDASVLYWPAGGGLTLINTNTNNYVNVHDLTFSTGASGAGAGLNLGTTGAALAFGGVNSLYNLSFRGDDYTSNTANAFYWGVGLKITNWNNVNIDKITTAGVFSLSFGGPCGGVGFEYGGVPPNISGVVNVSNSSFFYQGIYAQLDDFWEGVTFTNDLFVGQCGAAGLYVPSGTHTGPLLQMIGNQFNVGGTQIDILTTINQIIMLGNTITVFGNNNFGAILGSSISPIVVGNMWNVAQGTSTTAIQMNGQNGIFQSNILAGLGLGLLLGSGSTNVNASQNSYQSVTVPISNSGTNNHIGVATQ